MKVTGNFKKFFGGEESLRPTMLSKTKLVDGPLDDTVNNNIVACHHRWHTCRLSATHLYFPALRAAVRAKPQRSTSMVICTIQVSFNTVSF